MISPIAPDPPPSSLPTLKVASLRDTFRAPELDRILLGTGLDLSAMDQLESLKIRVEAGVKLVDNRALASIAAGRRLRSRLLACLGMAIGGIAASFYGAKTYPLPAIVIGIALGTLLALLGFWLLRLRHDLLLLRSFAGRYRSHLEACEDLSELKELSRTIHSEVRSVGGAEG